MNLTMRQRLQGFAQFVGMFLFFSVVFVLSFFLSEWIYSLTGLNPPEWLAHDWKALENLVERIVERRSKVRELIMAFRESSRQPFPRWAEAAPKAAAQANSR